MTNSCLIMLSQLLDHKRFDLQIVGAAALTSEVIARTAETNAPLICIASLSPDGVPHLRALCKRVRQRFTEIKIVVGRLGNGAANSDDLLAAGADKISTTMIEFRDQVVQMSQIIEPEINHGQNSPGEAETTHGDSETLM